MNQVIEFDLPEAKPAAETGRKPIPLVINKQDTGYKIFAPSIEHIALFSRVGSRMYAVTDKMDGIFRFLEAVTDQDSYTYIINRFEDPADPLDFDFLSGLLVKMAETFGEDTKTVAVPALKKS